MFHRNQEGANALEFALVLPILVVLMFGAITFGLAFNTKLQLEHATREAVRFAATLPDAATTTWYEDVFSRLVQTSAGTAPVTDPSLTICVSVVTGSATTPTTARLEGQGSSGYASSDEMVANGTSGATNCFDDGLDGDRVQVVVSRGANLSAVFYTQSITLSSTGIAVYEAGSTP